MPLSPEILSTLRRDQLEKIYAQQVLRRLRNVEKARAETPDVWRRFKNDPFGFVTQLGQCVGDSWRGWNVVLKAAYAQPLDEDELAFFRRVAERDPPTKRVRELWLIVGRRGGKDSIASLVALHAGKYADCSELRPGERALVACFATDRDQAAIVHSYIRGYFVEKPELQSWLDPGGLSDSYRAPIRMRNRVDVQVMTNNFRAPRGRPIAAAIFDEVAFWRSEDSATPDVETYAAVVPGMATVPGSMLIGISTPHMRRGLLYDKWKKHFGTPDDNVLVIVAETRLMNPRIDVLSPGLIDEAMSDDPERARAEYLADWRRDLAPYVPPEVVDALYRDGEFEHEPERGVQYRAFFDASGGTSDSMTLAISHRTPSDHGSLDLLREQRPPFDPSTTIAEFASALRPYGVSGVRGDRYAGVWPEAEFKKHGITYEVAEQSKSEIYLSFLPLMMSGKVSLLDDKRLVAQLCGLERRATRNGRDTVDHIKGAHDDVANAAAGALVMVTGDAHDNLWSRSDLQ